MARIYFPNGSTKDIETVSLHHVSNAVGEKNIKDITDFVKLNDFNTDEEKLIKNHPHGTFYGVCEEYNDDKLGLKPLYIFCVEC